MEDGGSALRMMGGGEEKHILDGGKAALSEVPALMPSIKKPLHRFISSTYLY